MKIHFNILIIAGIIFLISCQEKEKTNTLIQQSKKSCYEEDLSNAFANEVNFIFENSDRIKKVLDLNNNEATLICKETPSKLEDEEIKKLILKLSKMIADTSTISTQYVTEECYINIVKGDLALIAIYKSSPFPFAKALKKQLCGGSGGAISKEIKLPRNLPFFMAYDRRGIQKSYLEYFSKHE